MIIAEIFMYNKVNDKDTNNIAIIYIHIEP